MEKIHIVKASQGQLEGCYDVSSWKHWRDDVQLAFLTKRNMSAVRVLL